MFDDQNHIFKLSVGLVNNTGRSLFLTGKAGTGKTTFLKHIKENSTKKSIIVAPTGVAAINAGGVTIHSFFNLPPSNFIPEYRTFSQPNFIDRYALFKALRINSAKRKIMMELELLIIDEISMVRADLLDAMDIILRSYRKKMHVPFGGVQVLFIGDLFQLPPIVQPTEWETLKQFYNSPFFFDSLVSKEIQPLYVELKKIYRQSDNTFISILNKIRNNVADYEDLEILNAKYSANIPFKKEEKYIYLTTHNYKADNVNNENLHKLNTPQYFLEAKVTGDFMEKAAPADTKLLLKEGAQIMFVKNDGELKRYYNGKLAIVESIKPSADKDDPDPLTIMVKLEGEESLMRLSKDKWKNVQYNYNEASDEIEENETGTFEQYPVRLAWAITIHKSQGLTFERAVIDAGDSFSAGQVYVALSRCTTLDGICLQSRIMPNAIRTNTYVIAYAENETPLEKLEEILAVEQNLYSGRRLVDHIDLTKLVQSFSDHMDDLKDRQIPEKEKAYEITSKWLEAIHNQQKIAQKFQQQISSIVLKQEDVDEVLLKERMEKAIQYFTNFFENDLIKPIKAHGAIVKKQSKTKQYHRSILDIEKHCIAFINIFYNLNYKDQYFGAALKAKNNVEKLKSSIAKDIEDSRKKPVKGETRKISLEAFNAGRTITEIATERQLTPGTIEGHLLDSAIAGELELFKAFSKERIDKICTFIKLNPTILYADLRNTLNNEYGFNEIRAAYFHLNLPIVREQK